MDIPTSALGRDQRFLYLSEHDMHAGTEKKLLEGDISIHIFAASAALVGVCLTVIGLIRVVVATINIDTFADNLLAIDALLFLGSCLLAYWALRTRGTGRMYRVERAADALFIAGLLLMTAVCSIIAYELL